MNRKKLTFWEKLARWSLYLALFLIPLLVLPWTIFPLTLSKQTVLIFLVILAFINWLISGIATGELTYNKNPINIVILTLAVFTALSAWFSGANRLGFFGRNGGEVDVFINILAFGLLFFLVSSLFRDKDSFKKVLNTLLVSSVIALIYGLLQMFGLWILPWEFTKNVAFNTIGATNAFAIYFGVIFSILLALILKNKQRYSLIIFAFLALAALFLIGFWPVFAGLIVIAIMLVFDIGFSDKRKVYLPLILIALSLITIIVQFNLISLKVPAFNLPAEATPSLTASWRIAQSSLLSGVKNFVLGSGPASFSMQYDLFKNPRVNSTPFWEIHFNQGANAIISHLVTGGVLGMIIWLLLFGLLIKEIIKNFRAEKQPLAIGLAFLLLLLLFYSQNFVIYFLIFALGGLLVTGKTASFSLIKPPQRTIILSLATIFLIVFVGLFAYLQIQHYFAAVIYYNNGLQLAEEDLSQAIVNFEKAVKLDPRNDNILQALSAAYLYQVNKIINDQSANTEESQRKFTATVDSAINSGREAVNANPLNSGNWINFGQIYEELIPFIEGAAIQAVENYQKAAALEPTNPEIFFHIANSYFKEASRAQNNNYYQESINNLDRSLSLKIDYAPAHLLLMRVYYRLGKTADASPHGDYLEKVAGGNPDIIFALGVVYFQADQLEKAKNQFKKVIKLNPDHAEANLYLQKID